MKIIGKGRVTFRQLLVSSRFSEPIDYGRVALIDEVDLPRIKPRWFRLLELVGRKTSFEPVVSFVSKRTNERDYTLPLPKQLYDRVYLKPMSLKHRNVMLNIMYKGIDRIETESLLRIRSESFINQHNKKCLYELASSTRSQMNVYKHLFNMGFGFEFNMLSLAYERTSNVRETLIDILKNTASMVEFDTLFRSSIKSLISSVRANLYVLLFGYLGIVYATYYIIGLDYTTVPFVFVFGRLIIDSLLSGGFIGAFLSITTIVGFLWLMSFLRIRELFLFISKDIFDIIVFFESYKFYQTFKLLLTTTGMSERRILPAAISSIETDQIKVLLQTKLEAILDDRQIVDIYAAFLTSSSFFKEEDIVYILGMSGDRTNSSTLTDGLASLIADYQVTFKLRERDDVQKIEVYTALIGGVTQLALTVLFVIGDMQAFNVAM